MSVFFIRDVEQTQEQISRLAQAELFDINIHCMRKSLFKYFPNNSFTDEKGNKHNYSLDALRNNTVFYHLQQILTILMTVMSILIITNLRYKEFAIMHRCVI